MTVKELIEELSKLEPDRIVFTNDYESGLIPASELKLAFVKKCGYSEGYFTDWRLNESSNAELAVIIG